MLICLGIMAISTQAMSTTAISSPGGAYLVFAGKFGGELNAEAIQACKEIDVAGCAAGSKIFQFTLHITHKGKTTTFKSTEGKLTDKMIAILASLEEGDAFHFERIKAKLPTGGTVDVYARKFLVV